MAIFKTLKVNGQAWTAAQKFEWIFWYGLKRMGITVCGVYLRAPQGDTNLPPQPEGYTFHTGRPIELLPYLDQCDQLSEEFLLEADQREDFCGWAMLGGVLAGFRFCTTKRVLVTSQIDIWVPNGFIYAYKAYVLPEHRRKHIDRWNSHVTDLKVAKTNYRWVWYSHMDNFPQRLNGDTHPNRRAQRFGLTGWIKLFGHQIPFSTRSAKWLNVRFLKKGDQPRRTL